MATGDPIGGDLCSKTLNINDQGAVNFLFDIPYLLESGKKYAIVLVSTGFDVSNNLRWVQYVGDGYANGLRLYSTDSGSSWAQAATRDMNFSIWSGVTGNVLEDFFSGSGSVLGVYGTIHIAQTFIASSDYTTTKFSSSFQQNGTPVGTITASIRKVEGETYTEVPTKATNPTPTDAAADVTLDQETITWEDGGGADTYDVYYGESGGSLVKVSSEQAGTSFTISGITSGSPFDYIISRSWRIDSTNVQGTTTGDVWSFTTIRLNAPAPTYWYAAGPYFYQLLIDTNGNYGSPPPGGVENTDYVIVPNPNLIVTPRRLVVAANSKIWYEDI